MQYTHHRGELCIVVSILREKFFAIISSPVNEVIVAVVIMRASMVCMCDVTTATEKVLHNACLGNLINTHNSRNNQMKLSESFQSFVCENLFIAFLK